VKYYPSISLEGGENNENPEWAACSRAIIGTCDLPNTKKDLMFIGPCIIVITEE